VKTPKTSGRTRVEAVRRYITSRGIVGASSTGSRVFAIPGVRLIVTSQTAMARGQTIWARFLDYNDEMPTVLVRAVAMPRTPPPTIEDCQVLIRLEDYMDLVMYRYEKERGA